MHVKRSPNTFETLVTLHSTNEWSTQRNLSNETTKIRVFFRRQPTLNTFDRKHRSAFTGWLVVVASITTSKLSISSICLLIFFFFFFWGGRVKLWCRNEKKGSHVKFIGSHQNDAENILPVVQLFFPPFLWEKRQGLYFLFSCRHFRNFSVVIFLFGLFPFVRKKNPHFRYG